MQCTSLSNRLSKRRRGSKSARPVNYGRCTMKCRSNGILVMRSRGSSSIVLTNVESKSGMPTSGESDLATLRGASTIMACLPYLTLPDLVHLAIIICFCMHRIVQRWLEQLSYRAEQSTHRSFQSGHLMSVMLP